MFRWGNIVLLTTRFFDVAKFTNLTPLSLLSPHCEISSSHIVKFQVLTLWNFRFSHCEISSPHIVKFQVLTLWNFKFSHREFQILTLWKFKFSHCEISNSHFVNFKFSHCEISSSQIVKFHGLTLWNFKFTRCEISIFHIVEFPVLTLWNFKFSHREISGSHSGDYDEYCLLGCHYVFSCLADLYQLLKETFASIWVLWSFRQRVHLRCWCSSNQIACLLALGWRDKLVREEIPCIYNQVLSVHYKYIHRGWRWWKYSQQRQS